MNPIFILGITERSGTSFLFHLLCLHPDCDPGGPIWENYLLVHADALVRYADAVYDSFNPEWRVDEIVGPRDLLLRHVGDGLIEYLKLQLGHRSPDEVSMRPTVAADGSLKRLVTKTPSVRNLRAFFRIFPRSPLLIIVRDGRAVVESGSKTFGWDYEWAIRTWRGAASEIIAFDREHHASGRKYLIVKYEDLCEHTEKTLRKVFTFLALNADAYDFESAKRLPVVGSSELRVRGADKVHWQPVERSAQFNPLARSESWGRALHERFNWIAGEHLVQLGYSMHNCSTNSLLWMLWNTMHDVRWAARVASQRIRRAFGSAS